MKTKTFRLVVSTYGQSHHPCLYHKVTQTANMARSGPKKAISRKSICPFIPMEPTPRKGERKLTYAGHGHASFVGKVDMLQQSHPTSFGATHPTLDQSKPTPP